MYNELFSIGPFTFYGYGLMIAIAIIAAYITTEIRAKRLGLKQEIVFNLVVWCAIGGLLGAKLLYIIVELPSIIEDPSKLLDVANGFVVYGGILGGILTGYTFCRVKKLKFLDYFDLAMPSIAIAQGFGRIGCFLAGCCYGIEHDSCISITFHNSDFAPNNVPLVPTQLLSSGLNFIHFFILIIAAKRKKASGQIASLYLIFYSAGRYVMEMFRGDLDRGSIGEFSTSQFISIFLFIAGVALFVITTMYSKRHPSVPVKTSESSEESIEAESDDNNESISVEGDDLTETNSDFDISDDDVVDDISKKNNVECSNDSGDGSSKENNVECSNDSGDGSSDDNSDDNEYMNNKNK